MTKDDNINIKLEVNRVKTSGKLMITARFNSNAPNVFKDKDSYFWIPTIEEKDLINEAFGLMSIDGDYVSTEETVPKLEEIEEEKPIQKPVIEEEFQPTHDTQPMEDEKKPSDFSSFEKPEESDIFEVIERDIKTDDLDKDIDKKTEDNTTNADENTVEEHKSDNSETEKKEKDDGVSVGADSDAIEEELKKRMKKINL